ncbi:MAG: HD domain-containing protein [Treponema sp.]|nr:HD domain-containing protein [Treponema sp.]
MNVLENIYASGFSAYLYGFGAIDTWLGLNPLCSKDTNRIVHVLTTADTAGLAKLFENLRYPGVDLADAALDETDRTWYFRCVDSIGSNDYTFFLLDFYYDCKTKKFHDPHEIYPLLKEIRQKLSGQKIGESQKNILHFLACRQTGGDHSRIITDAALILAKYFPDSEAKLNINEIVSLLKKNGKPVNQWPDKSPEDQRVFLSELITSPNPGLGFELLKTCGFISRFWPELAVLEQADHSKEFHPEGNAWEHTIETFRHRKTGTSKANLQAVYAHDLRLSLGLLLHDCGKPMAPSTGNNRYDGHAELGEFQARRFLERLGFGSSLTNDVCFLVRHHMLPAALSRLPLFRTEQIMSSALFPLLMELYRCDESSSFKGLDGYYESSAVYQQFLRNKRNPYRTADGKKLNRKQKSSAKKTR